MKKRIIALFSALLIAVGLSVTVASPAQAWSYCTNTIINNRVMLYNSQGYCPSGTWVAVQQGSPGQCVNLSIYGASNWAGAFANSMSVAAVGHDAPDCQAGAWKTLPAESSDPDLFNDGMYRTMSSIRFGG